MVCIGLTSFFLRMNAAKYGIRNVLVRFDSKRSITVRVRDFAFPSQKMCFQVGVVLSFAVNVMFIPVFPSPHVKNYEVQRVLPKAAGWSSKASRLVEIF